MAVATGQAGQILLNDWWSINSLVVRQWADVLMAAGDVICFNAPHMTCLIHSRCVSSLQGCTISSYHKDRQCVNSGGSLHLAWRSTLKLPDSNTFIFNCFIIAIVSLDNTAHGHSALGNLWFEYLWAVIMLKWNCVAACRDPSRGLYLCFFK